MAELFSRYSISEIILFIIILAIAIKSFVQFIDWAKVRTRQAIEETDKPKKLTIYIAKHQQELKEIKQELDSLKELISLLIASDRDDIKYSITKDYHYFYNELGYIDDYSLDCLEKKYSHYQDEGGNSFIQQLMQKLRNLPRRNDK